MMFSVNLTENAKLVIMKMIRRDIANFLFPLYRFVSLIYKIQNFKKQSFNVWSLT